LIALSAASTSFASGLKCEGVNVKTGEATTVTVEDNPLQIFVTVNGRWYTPLLVDVDESGMIQGESEVGYVRTRGELKRNVRISRDFNSVLTIRTFGLGNSVERSDFHLNCKAMPLSR
jgi:hypothetical protein